MKNCLSADAGPSKNEEQRTQIPQQQPLLTTDTVQKQTINADEPTTSTNNDNVTVIKTQSEPNKNRPHYYIVAEGTKLNDLHLGDDEDDDEENAPKFSLKFISEIINMTNKSNVTLKSCLRVDDNNTAREALPSAQPSEFNAEITVLYSDNASFRSSESLIAKDSMGYSLHIDQPIISQPKPMSSTTVPQCPTQPPPYHVATAHDTASVQLTPAAARPLVLYSAPPLQGAPPTYSALMRIGQREIARSFSLFSRRDVQIQPSAPFVAPPPPPSYAQAQGFCVSHPLQFADVQDSAWGNEPVTVICPYCNNFIVTSVHFRRSNLTHYSALALCICGCWPCCLLPYCMKSCKSAHHDCPICGNVVGVFSPWQVA